MGLQGAPKRRMENRCYINRRVYQSLHRFYETAFYHGCSRCIASLFLWVCHPAEQKLWKRLHVRKWQAKIPDMSRIFVKIMPEKKLTKENYENLPRMIEETCVAEWTHILLSIAGLGLLKIWSGVGGVCITIIYIVLGNLPFIVVQRYNRPRLQKLFAMQQRKK